MKSIELTQGDDIATTQAIRYQDLSLPPGVTARIRLTPQGIENLAYDSDGDGTFETTVTPTVSVSGSTAQDAEPPTVSISAAQQQSGLLVTVTAADAGSGVKGISYSLDGANFQPYTAAFSVNPNQGTVVYAFADDNVANRSSLVTYYPSSTGNQVDNAQFFVRQHYLDFLSRQPDASGLGFWTNNITSCGADAQCAEVRRINTSAAFFLSIEFQNTGYLFYRTYKAAFGNLPNKPVPVTRADFLPDTQAIGNGVVVNQGDWQTQLDNNKQAFVLAFVQRQAFLSAYPLTMTADAFVAQLDANAGGVLSAADKANLVAMLGRTPSDATKRAQVLRAMAENQTLQQREFNKAFVLMQYFGYLQRDPDSGPDTDFSGYNFWLSKLNQFNGNFVQAEMVKAFINADEYRKGFGQ
jgi:hypothetical protein